MIPCFFISKKRSFNYIDVSAAMAELVDALDSGSSRGNPVDVRLILAAMNIAIIGNGEIRNPAILKKLLSGYSKFIAADGGANNCLILGITPDLIIGDLDSITPETLQAFAHVPTKKFPCDKDFTDLELAVREAEDAENITLFCATGSRADHSLANIYLLAQFPNRILIETEEETIGAFQKKIILNCTPGQTLSLIPMGNPAVGVTSKGLKWELNQATLDTHFLSISNVCLANSVFLSLDSGTLVWCLKRSG